MKKITFILSLIISSVSFAQSTANYNISITTIWNSTNHTSLPSNAHWSPLAGATHKNVNDILEFGVTAPTTNGIKNIAETGSTSNFNTEVNNAIAAGNADQYLEQGFSPFAGNNSNASLNNITVSKEFPYITLVSMVAPSPDWFIAVNNLDLRSGNDAINNGWKDTFTMDVFAYDAGTDSGTNYSSSNSATSPREPIALVSGFPINGNKMATITFTYNNSTLSTNNLNKITDLKIYPNPTKGNITILNVQNVELKPIEIYSVLGKLIKQIPVDQNSNKINLNLTDLNTGLYLLKLQDNTNTYNTQKLVIH
ncbi:spondin domain-containing protein [uncultured Algibacter sp.]|uniref:T9SS type A sorting domain-containing protein n=1 Tax=uncultured Algibacter sp. TaxID=298659 RepID=UPI0026075F95|nr:spondin domain-containing protein [uncultured Algibacter sp.]